MNRPIPDIPTIPVLAQAGHAVALIETKSVVCVGTFDGVHCGHQAIIARGREIADAMHLPLWILSFHPHPKSIVHPEITPHLLTEPDERVALFAHYGADGAVIQHFDAKFAAQSAEEFALRVLADSLRAAAIVVGADFRFGHDRQGSPEWLKEWGEKTGRQVEVIGLKLEDETGERIGSGPIRKIMEQGDFGRVLKLLGHPYPVSGEVVAGLARGREIGYPTWNLALSQVKLPPPVGVYAGWSFRPTPRPGMAYYGSNPTFGGVGPRLEINILSGSAEDRTPRHPSECFWLTDFIRPEVRFATAEELKGQLAEDERVVRQRLKV